MCLITFTKTEEEVLKEDITVYKTIKNPENAYDICDCRSVHNDYGYNYEKLNKAIVLKALPFDKNTSYLDFQVKDVYNKFMGKGDQLKVYSEGYHFFKTLDRARSCLDYKEIVVKCTIPKGNTVIYDNTNLGVASNIIIHEPID